MVNLIVHKEDKVLEKLLNSGEPVTALTILTALDNAGYVIRDKTLFDKLLTAKRTNDALHKSVQHWRSLYEGRNSLIHAGHNLFTYAQKMSQKIKHHHLQSMLPLPEDELIGYLTAVEKSRDAHRQTESVSHTIVDALAGP